MHIGGTCAIVAVYLVTLKTTLLFTPRLKLEALYIICKIFLVMCKIAGLSKCFTGSLFRLTFRFSLTLKVISVILKVVVVGGARCVVRVLSATVNVFVLMSKTFGVRATIRTGHFNVRE